MALIFLHGRGLTRQVLDSVYEESNYFTTPDPVDVCKNHLHYEVVRSFGMKETFEFKILRRATAAALPGKSLRGLDQETRGYTNPVPDEVRS
jgi:hypothetical protein